jgi:lysophospholipase L1-like esterase
MLRGLLSVCVLLWTVSLAPCQPASKPELPKVVLIGDSIRLGYAPLVAKRLQGKAVIVSPAANGGDSSNVLKNLRTWVIQEQPDVVYLNCGLHDLKLDKTSKKHQVPLEQYEANLKEIVARIRKETKAALVFASTTPILDDRHAKRKASFDRFEADVLRYNRTAIAVMQELKVPVHDLHRVVEQGDPQKLLLADGTHYTEAGKERQAEAVADYVLRQLAVSRHR